MVKYSLIFLSMLYFGFQFLNDVNAGEGIKQNKNINNISQIDQAGRKDIQKNKSSNLVFIHHSCGSRWLKHSLYKVLLSKKYIEEFNDIQYKTVVTPDPGRPASLGERPGDRTDVCDWIFWFNDYLSSIVSYDCQHGKNRIIMYKSCYSTCFINYDGKEPGDPFSRGRMLTNYRAVYRHPDGPGNTYTYNGHRYYPLEDIFAMNPDILFIAVTTPPRHFGPKDGILDEQAYRARKFKNWMNDWLKSYNKKHPGLNNVVIFDWFEILAYPDDHPSYPNRLKEEYGGNKGNSHPNDEANAYSSEEFSPFLDASWLKFINKSK